MKDIAKSKEKIIEELEKRLSKDLTYDSGFILGSMCSEPLKFATEIYSKYISKNLGDPGLFPGTMELEHEIIQELGGLFGCRNVVGTITTGGTESNIIAMRIARNLFKNKKSPEFIVPASAHISFDKGAELLGITLKKAKLTKDFYLDLNHLSSLISENTIGLVGVAGTTSLGLIDPIEKLAKISEKNSLFLHVDAAFGGFILPFLKELGYNIPRWDFSIKNVLSITADPHKMGLAPIPSGGFLLKPSSLYEEFGYEIPYLAGGGFKHFNILGTRIGASTIAFWALWNYLGKEGYKNIVKECMEATSYFMKRINEIPGIKVVVKPIMNIIGITTENGEKVEIIDEELRKKKWKLGLFNNLKILRAVIMPHVKKEHIDKFCIDLELITKKLFN